MVWSGKDPLRKVSVSLVGVRVELRIEEKHSRRGISPVVEKHLNCRAAVIEEETARPPPGDSPHNLLRFSKGAKCSRRPLITAG